jgi:hypothetical protein
LFAHGNKYQKRDISDRVVNNRRNRIEPIYGKAIHDYVPFYFNPKNAMLYKRKEMQDDIVILVFDTLLITYPYTIFTDGNASSDGTKFFNNLDDLDKLRWRCLRANNWINFRDGRRVRMAEVLVPNYVGFEYLKKVVCYNFDTYMRLKSICHKDVVVEIDQRFYF